MYRYLSVAEQANVNFGCKSLNELARGVTNEVKSIAWIGMFENLDSVKTGFGYYTGTPNGLFISIANGDNPEYRLQMRTVDNGSSFFFRTKEYSTWSEWKSL